MHLKGFLITKKIPTKDKIEEMLEEYYCDNEENDSGFSWDWYQLGGRFAGRLKIKAPSDKFDLIYLNAKRNYKYFISDILEEIENNSDYSELDYLNYMGLNDGFLYVDGAYYEDLIDFDISDSLLIITEDGYFNIYGRYESHVYIPNEQYKQEVKELDLTGCFITVIDFHDY